MDQEATVSFKYERVPVSHDSRRLLPEVGGEHTAYQVFVHQPGQERIDRKHRFSGAVFLGWTADEIHSKFNRPIKAEAVRVYRAATVDSHLQALAMKAQGVDAPVPELVEWHEKDLTDKELGEIVLSAGNDAASVGAAVRVLYGG